MAHGTRTARAVGWGLAPWPPPWITGAGGTAAAPGGAGWSQQHQHPLAATNTRPPQSQHSRLRELSPTWRSRTKQQYTGMLSPVLPFLDSTRPHTATLRPSPSAAFPAHKVVQRRCTAWLSYEAGRGRQPPASPCWPDVTPLRLLRLGCRRAAEDAGPALGHDYVVWVAAGGHRQQGHERMQLRLR